MLREIHDPLSVRAVAKEVGGSPYQLIRQFAAMFGETPHQFRIRARIEQAKLLLAADDLSVTEVCLEIGLTSLGSFSDLFTRRVGMAPSAYRRRVRSSAAVPGSLHGALFPGCLTLMAGDAGLAIFEKHAARRLPDSAPAHRAPSGRIPCRSSSPV
jgi:AraC-like DNA-binding protein